MVLMFERPKPARTPDEPFDSYFAMFGERMTMPDLLDIRETEDYLIELEHITEENRVPIPAYLALAWEEHIQGTTSQQPRSDVDG